MNRIIYMITFIIFSALILLYVFSESISYYGKATYKNKQPQQPPLEDYDYTNNLCEGDNVTTWEHDTVCKTCLKSSTHQEYMTQICLGCGTKHECISDFKSVAIRNIVKDGKWIEHMKLYNNHIFDRKRG